MPAIFWNYNLSRYEMGNLPVGNIASTIPEEYLNLSALPPNGTINSD